MNHRLETLGLALFAALAVGALVASIAVAQQGKLTADGPVTLDLSELGGGGQNAITVFNDKLECPGSTYTGHRYNVTPHELIPVSATTVTVTPHYNQEGCVAVHGELHLPSTILMNGCDYVLHVGAATLVEDQYSVSTDIVCPVNKRIEVETFLSHPGGIRVCTLIIKPQNGLTGATVTTDTSTDDLEVSGTFKGLHVERSGACKGEEVTTTTGELHLKTTVKGTNGAGSETGITVTG